MSVDPAEILAKVEANELELIDELEDKIDVYLRANFRGSPVYYDIAGVPQLSEAGWRELQARYSRWLISFDSSPKNESYWVFTPKSKAIR